MVVISSSGFTAGLAALRSADILPYLSRGIQHPDDLVRAQTIGLMESPDEEWDAPEDVLFIDDREDNIRAGIEAGFKGHVFRGAEGAVQALRDHGIAL